MKLSGYLLFVATGEAVLGFILMDPTYMNVSYGAWTMAAGCLIGSIFAYLEGK